MKYIQYIFIIIIAVCVVACTRQQPQPCDTIGCAYLGVQYVGDPLGEEIYPDTDPLIRLDAFDCVTFVETALAGGDVKKLTQIRYRDGQISFINRNHFTESDWIPNNADLIYDVTDQYGETRVRHVHVDKQSWFKKVHGLDIQIDPVDVWLKYLPYDGINSVVTDQPLLVLFVVDNPSLSEKIGTDIAVSHMGFLLPNGMLRHASSRAEAVVDTDFKEYVRSRAKNKNNLGIALYGIK